MAQNLCTSERILISKNEQPRVVGPTRLRHNIAALGGMQIANYLAPLITLPYLTRVLGVEGFGKLAFVQVVMAILILLTDYGFSWSATRQIAANKNNPDLISKIFSVTWATQWALVVGTAILFGLAVINVPVLKQDAMLMAAGFLMVIGNVLFPIWLLQGLERMREVALMQVIGKLVSVVLIFTLVKSKNDIISAVIIYGVGPVIAGFMSLVWLRSKDVVRLQYFSAHDLQATFLEGGNYFISTAFISFYTSLIPLILGLVAGQVALSYFSLADRIRRAIQSLLSPVSQSLYPRMSYLYKNNPDSARAILKKSALAIFIILGALSIILYIFSGPIIYLLGGQKFDPATSVLRWMAFVPFFIGVSNLFGVQVLLANGLVKQVNTTAATVGFLVLMIIFPVTNFMAQEGAAMIVFFSEAIVAIVYSILVIRGKYWRNND